ncbi:MAG: YfhO family protein [Planctomycetota bacterium]
MTPRDTLGLRLRVLATLAALAAAVLFEPLFGAGSPLAVDPRAFAPFCALAEAGDGPRAMNIASLDLAAWLLPERLAQLEALAAGRLPLWNPSEGFGQPRLAMLGYTPFYPSALLHVALPPLRALAASLALHLVLLGFGTWCAQRRAGLSPLAALAGGVVMMLSGYVTAHFQLPLFVRTIAWLPWLHLAFARVAERPCAARAGQLALCVGASLLAGFPQIALLSIYAAALLALPAVRRAGGRAAIAVAAAVLAGGALACVQLLPATELLGESWRRDGFEPSTLRAKGLAPQSLVGFVLPHFFGAPVADVDVRAPALPEVWDFPSYARWQDQEVQNNFEENALYVGLAPLVLALLSLTGGRRALRAALGLAAALALAMAAPGAADLAWLLPGLDAGNPKRVLFLAAYALAWLAALGAERIARSARGLALSGALLAALGTLAWAPFERWLLPGVDAAERAWFAEVVARDLRVALVAGVALLTAGALVRAARARAALVLLIGATALELIAFARHTNPWQELREPYPATPAVEWLAAQGAAERWRTVTFHDQTVLVPSVAQRFGLRSCQSLAGLLPRRSAELLRALEPDCLQLDNPVFLAPLARIESLHAPLLDLVGARYVVTGGAGYARLSEQPGLRLAYGDEREAIAIFERAGALPPAFLVDELRVISDRGERLAALAAPDFEPARVGVLDLPPAGLPAEGLARAEVVYRRTSPETIELELSTDGPAFLVVTETRLPGWRCEVDGEPVDTVAADHAFLGVPLAEAGRHRVVLRYAPRSFALGAVLSLAGLAISAAAVLRRPPRARAKAG